MEYSRRPRFIASRSNKTAERIAVAVVGCGYWGSKHVRVLSGLPAVSTVVAVDSDKTARDAISAAFPAAITLDDISAALEMVDAVVIATPPTTHYSMTLRALLSGKHALVEKPMALSSAEAKHLDDEARRRNLILMVGHTFEFNGALKELRRRMDEGELGKILYLHSARLNLGLYRSDVNVVWDLAPHDVSIMNYLLRATPDAVRAWGSSMLSPQKTDLAYFQLDYGSRGVTGYGHVSWLDPRKVRQVTVVGDRKMAVYDDLAEEKLRVFDRGLERETSLQGQVHLMPLSYRYGDIVSPHVPYEEPLQLEDRYFLECVQNDARPVNGSSGHSVITVLEAIDSSIRKGGSAQPPGVSAPTLEPTLLPIGA